jgi:hypothetical protein
MKGIDVLMAEVANLSLKGCIVPDRGSMIWRRPLEICFLLAALVACKAGENDMSEGLKDPDWHERARAVRALGGSQDHAAAVRALDTVFQNDPDHHVRMDVTFALGQLGGRTRPRYSSRRRPAPMNLSSGLPPWTRSARAVIRARPRG